MCVCVWQLTFDRSCVGSHYKLYIVSIGEKMAELGGNWLGVYMHSFCNSLVSVYLMAKQERGMKACNRFPNISLLRLEIYGQINTYIYSYIYMVIGCN